MNDLNKYKMTLCGKKGVKINKTNNDYKKSPFQLEGTQVKKKKNLLKTVDKELDLDINNYDETEIFGLFGLTTDTILDEDVMKSAKKIAQKMHPDFSKLDAKYFTFYTKAYSRLELISQQQVRTSGIREDFSNEDHNKMLDTMFQTNKNLKQEGNFNDWFNEKFEQTKLEDEEFSSGYGDWMKSDEGIDFTSKKVKTMDAMNREMNKRKREVQAMTVYQGVTDYEPTSSMGGSLIMYEGNNGFSSNNSMGMDLKQAYEASVFGVTEDDYHLRKKYKSVSEYESDRTNIAPLTEEESWRLLAEKQMKENELSATYAHKSAQRYELQKQRLDIFSSSLKQITDY